MLALAVSFSTSTVQATPLPGGVWSGAVGPVGSTILPDPSRPPVEFFEDGIAGRLVLTLAAPTAAAPNGTYTAQLALYNGNQSFTFRHKGSLRADGGGVQDSWLSSGKPAASIFITLNRSVMNPEAAFLSGEATLNGATYPIFALPQVFSAKTPLSSSVAGAFTTFLYDELGSGGTGFGSATIMAAGSVKLAGTTGDGSKFTQSSSVLLSGGKHFFTVGGPVGKAGFIGAWALRDPSLADADWSGYSLHARSSIPVSRVSLSSYSRPTSGQSALPWITGSLHLELNPDFFVANGDVTYDGKSRFAAVGSSGILNGANANGLQVKSLQLNPSSGLVTGSVEYFYIPSPGSEARREMATLSGAINKKSAEIHGRIQARRNVALSGPFEIAPK